jgi:hypothetical protein
MHTWMALFRFVPSRRSSPVYVWQILELRFTFEEGAWDSLRLTDFDRTFEQPPLFVTTPFRHKMLTT